MRGCALTSMVVCINGNILGDRHTSQDLLDEGSFDFNKLMTQPNKASFCLTHPIELAMI